jgi:hypothetical protein
MRFNFKVDEASKIAHMHPDSNGLAIYYRFSTDRHTCAQCQNRHRTTVSTPVGNTCR